MVPDQMGLQEPLWSLDTGPGEEGLCRSRPPKKLVLITRLTGFEFVNAAVLDLCGSPQAGPWRGGGTVLCRQAGRAYSLLHFLSGIKLLSQNIS